MNYQHRSTDRYSVAIAFAPLTQRVEGRGKRVEVEGTSAEVLAVVARCMSKIMHQTQMRELDAMGIEEAIDEQDHWTCCKDDNLALCGIDLTDVPWVTEDDGTNCQRCDDLNNRLPDQCQGCPAFTVREALS